MNDQCKKKEKKGRRKVRLKTETEKRKQRGETVHSEIHAVLY